MIDSQKFLSAVVSDLNHLWLDKQNQIKEITVEF